MRRTLQWIALALAMMALTWWALAGAHRGWTQTTVTRTAVDEVTGLEQQINEKRFVPGVDFLGAALLGSGALALIALLFRSHPVPSRVPP